MIMCTNKRWIKNRYTGLKLFVNCGHCPACLQQKADIRTLKVRNSVGKSDYAIFFHLTYANDHVPYIAKSDIFAKSSYDDKFNNVYIPIYRDSYVKRVRVDKYYNTLSRDISQGQIDCYNIQGVSLPELAAMAFEAPSLVNGSANRIAVLYYKDVQLFYKRLRINLQRRGFTFRFKYICAGEYGGKTKRCHFHNILILPCSAPYFVVKAAIAESWPFDDYGLTFRNTEIAKNAAAYVSSYVNCASSTPKLLTAAKETSPMFRTSMGIGSALDSFSFASVLQKFYDGDLRYDRESFRGQSLVTESVLLPKYVISRYFPRFKGYCWLTPDEVQSIFERPYKIFRGLIKQKLFLSDSEAHDIYTLISNKSFEAFKHGLDRVEYARIASRIWPLYTAQIYRENFKEVVSPELNFEAYDNIEDYFKGDVLAPTLDPLVFQVSHFETDPNLFRSNLVKSSRSTIRFFEKDKSRKARHSLFAFANVDNPNFHF